MRKFFLKVRARRMLKWWGKRMGRLWAYLCRPVAPILLWWRKRQLNRSILVLDALDWNMKRAGWNRTKRRQFWRDFIKRHEVRTAVLNKITQK